MTIARQWAAFARQTATASLPTSVATHAALCVADHLHAAMHGARSDTGALLRRYLGVEANAGGGVLAAEPMALYSGAISAVHEIDDVQQGTSLHPGSVIVAAALAAALSSRVSGTRLLAAIAVGYEVMVRLSVAAGHRHYHFFHSTATCGAIGAAAATSVILDLDEAKTAHAMSSAVALASGVWEGVNREAVTIKHLHPGFAAERGVRAARLAQLGLHGAEHAIEGDKGFLAALAQRGAHAPNESPGVDALDAILIRGLGESWRIEHNIFKRYPFCLGCFEPLEGLRRVLRESPHAASDVASIRVEMSTSSAWMVGQPDPQDQFQAKFSAPYALALVLAGHDPERAPMPEALLTDAAVLRWIAVIRVVADAELPRRRARVIVTWTDGTQTMADEPFRNLGAAEVRARFTKACRQYLGDEGARFDARIAAIAGSDDVGELTRWLAPALAL